MKWTETILNPTQCENPDPRWVEPKLPDFQLIQSLAREKGYSVGIHGSLKRDVDLIAAPWTDEAATQYELMEHIIVGIGARLIEAEPKPQGRIAYTIQIDGYYKPIDLSIMPPLSS